MNTRAPAAHTPHVPANFLEPLLNFAFTSASSPTAPEAFLSKFELSSQAISGPSACGQKLSVEVAWQRVF